MLASLRRTGAIMGKELTQLRRDKSTFAMIVLIPIMQLMLFGFAINADPKHMPTLLLMQDHGPLARDILVAMKNTDYFDVRGLASSAAAAQDQLQKGEIQFVVTIPPDFTRDVVRGRRPSLLIEADATDPTASRGALSAIEGVVDHVAAQSLTGPYAYLKGEKPGFGVMVHPLYNPEGFSRYNIVPGLMGVVLTMTGVMMTALSLTRERERGTMENLLSMPVRPIEVMAGKIMPYVLIGYIQSFIIVGAARLLFDVPILGSLALLSAILVVFLICNLALGFMLSASSQNQMQAMQLSFMVMLPSILLSGFMFPFWGMPVWAQQLGSLLPATYFIRVVRGILLKGAGFWEIWPHVWPLLVFMALITLLAMKFYKRTLD